MVPRGAALRRQHDAAGGRGFGEGLGAEASSELPRQCTRLGLLLSPVTGFPRAWQGLPGPGLGAARRPCAGQAVLRLRGRAGGPQGRHGAHPTASQPGAGEQPRRALKRPPGPLLAGVRPARAVGASRGLSLGWRRVCEAEQAVTPGWASSASQGWPARRARGRGSGAVLRRAGSLSPGSGPAACERKCAESSTTAGNPVSNVSCQRSSRLLCVQCPSRRLPGRWRGAAEGLHEAPEV